MVKRGRPPGRKSISERVNKPRRRNEREKSQAVSRSQESSEEPISNTVDDNDSVTSSYDATSTSKVPAVSEEIFHESTQILHQSTPHDACTSGTEPPTYSSVHDSPQRTLETLTKTRGNFCNKVDGSTELLKQSEDLVSPIPEYDSAAPITVSNVQHGSLEIPTEVSVLDADNGKEFEQCQSPEVEVPVSLSEIPASTSYHEALEISTQTHFLAEGKLPDDCIGSCHSDSPLKLTYRVECSDSEKITVRVVPEKTVHNPVSPTSKTPPSGFVVSTTPTSVVDETLADETPHSPVSAASEKPQTDGLSSIADRVLPTQEVVALLTPRLRDCLPPDWLVQVLPDCVYVLLATMPPFRVKRALCINVNGSIVVEANNKILPTNHEIYTDPMMEPCLKLSLEDTDRFAAAIRQAAYCVQSYKQCAGVDGDNAVEEWTRHPACVLEDSEAGDGKVLRTKVCSCVLPRSKRRCATCASYQLVLWKRERRKKLHSPGHVHEKTAHSYLTPRRMKTLLETKQTTVRIQGTTIRRLRERIAKLIEAEGVEVDDELTEGLKGCFVNATGFTKTFWEQQLKAHSVKKATAMKWHPLLIRWALLIKSSSSAAYKVIKDSGFIKLPSERTLYEYIHANPAKEGIQQHVVERLGEKMKSCKGDFYSYHVLMFDEMYLYKNIVYHKGTGQITGYVKLTEVEEELAQLHRELKADNCDSESPPVATTMLTYLVKGIANDNKAVVACFPCCALNKDQHKARTWDVIGALEIAGIKVLALIGDGSTANAAFFDSHLSAIPTASGVVFVTVNLYAIGRYIYFISDPPHLLKTQRNCLHNSGANGNTRLMMKNGEVLSWKTIIACFKSEEKDDLKFCHKLNKQNVFLNSYSCMKVSLAAQVMSKTVANFIKNESGMKNVDELVKFILYVNNTFDCLNGAHSSQASKTLNANLAPYEDVNDKRFDYLMEYLDYLKGWEAEVAALKIAQKDKKKRLLSSQTLRGLERTILGFTGAVKFLLGTRLPDPDGGKPEGFVMARAFQQDPLEHYFGRQRGCGGSSVHPTLQKFLDNQNSMDVQGNLGPKRRHGNTEELDERIALNQPVLKRKKVSSRQLSFQP